MKNKLIGVTGAKGYLGSYLLKTYGDMFVDLDCDVTNPNQIADSIQHRDVGLILHLAAKSNVNWCEKPENSKKVLNVNLRGTFKVTSAAEDAGIEVILLSSDHVFSGGAWGRFRRKENSFRSPVNFYGMSKLCAEQAQTVFDNLRVIRTSYLFDSQRLKDTFVSMRNGVEIDSPTFIYRSFMYLPDFATSLMQYISNITKMPKMLHIAGGSTVSWNTFHNQLARIYGVDNSILFTRNRYDNNNYAPRPKYGGLNVSLSKKLGIRQFNYIDGIMKMAEQS